MEKDEKVKKTTVVILTKSPWPMGRIGKKTSQDWYNQCAIAADLKRSNPFNTDVIVTSSTKVGKQREEQYYFNILLNKFSIILKKYGQGCETISQLRAIKNILSEKNTEKNILIVTWTHYLRVKYLLKSLEISNVTVVVAWGIPRPQELVTDFVLTIVNPFMDWFKLTDKFLDFVSARRASGNL